MKKFYIILAICLLPAAAPAQNVVITGVVLSQADSSALAGASIDINDGEFHLASGRGGRFVIERFPRRQAQLRFSFMGFETRRVTIDPQGASLSMDTVFLVPTTQEMDSLMVRLTPPIAVQKGDTTQFNAAAFKTHPDAEGDELIAKMPGVVIEEGKVEAQGEPVRKIYVDGVQLFGTNPMAALKNIPADAIESIQLFDEMSDQAQITGVDDGQTQKVMNIVTKSRSRNTTTARLEVSGGRDTGRDNDARYLAGGNLSRLTEHHKLSLSAMSNNVNSARFGQPDADEGKVDANGNPTGAMTGMQRIAETGAAYGYESGKKEVQLTASYNFSHNDSSLDRNSENNFFPLAGRYTSKTNLGNSVYDVARSTHRGEAKLAVNISPHDALTFSPNFSYSRNSTFQDLDGYRQSYNLNYQNGLPIMRSRSANSSSGGNLNLSGNLLYAHRFAKRGRSISTNLHYRINNRGSDRNPVEREKNNYNATTGLWNEVDRSRLQNSLVAQSDLSNTLRTRISYTEPVAASHRMVFSLVASRDWGYSHRQNYKFDPVEGEYSIRDTVKNNLVRTDYYSAGGGLGYLYANKKITFSAGADYLRQFRNFRRMEPAPGETRLQFDDAAPNLSLKYSIYKKKYLQLRYSGRTVLPRAEQMLNVPDVRNLGNINIGNPDLKPGYQHSTTLFYNAANTFRSTNLSLAVKATTISDHIAATTEVMPADRDTTLAGGIVPNRGAMVNRAINLDGYLSGSISATYSMALKPICSNLNLTLGLNYNRTPSIYGGVHNMARINSGNVRIGLTSNISERVDFNLYTNTAFNYTANTARRNTTFMTENLSYSLNWIIGRGWVFNTLLAWKYYGSSSSQRLNRIHQFPVNAGIGKKFLSRRNGELRIALYDILDRSRNLLHYIRDNSIQDDETNTVGRYLMARFSYRFNSMAHGKK